MNQGLGGGESYRDAGTGDIGDLIFFLQESGGIHSIDRIHYDIQICISHAHDFLKSTFAAKNTGHVNAAEIQKPRKLPAVSLVIFVEYGHPKDVHFFTCARIYREGSVRKQLSDNLAACRAVPFPYIP